MKPFKIPKPICDPLMEELLARVTEHFQSCEECHRCMATLDSYIGDTLAFKLILDSATGGKSLTQILEERLDNGSNKSNPTQ